MKRVNDKGFSLVEMLAVIALATLMILFITISIGTNVRNRAFRSSEKLESLINQARANALTKGTANGYLNIACVDGAYYTYVGEHITGGDDGAANKESLKKKGSKLCDSGIDIYLSGINVKNSEDVCCLHFKQSSGGLVGGADASVMVKKENVSYTKIIDGITGKLR